MTDFSVHLALKLTLGFFLWSTATFAQEPAFSSLGRVEDQQNKIWVSEKLLRGIPADVYKRLHLSTFLAKGPLTYESFVANSKKTEDADLKRLLEILGTIGPLQGDALSMISGIAITNINQVREKPMTKGKLVRKITLKAIAHSVTSLGGQPLPLPDYNSDVVRLLNFDLGVNFGLGLTLRDENEWYILIDRQHLSKMSNDHLRISVMMCLYFPTRYADGFFTSQYPRKLDEVLTEEMASDFWRTTWQDNLEQERFINLTNCLYQRDNENFKDFIERYALCRHELAEEDDYNTHLAAFFFRNSIVYNKVLELNERMRAFPKREAHESSRDFKKRYKKFKGRDGMGGVVGDLHHIGLDNRVPFEKWLFKKVFFPQLIALEKMKKDK